MSKDDHWCTEINLDLYFIFRESRIVAVQCRVSEQKMISQI